MLRRYTALIFIGLITNLAFGNFVFAQSKDAEITRKNKVKVARLGTGGKLIEVKLRDETKIKGYITEIKENDFVLVSKKSGASTVISYDRVKNVGRTFSDARKIGLAVAGGLLAFGIIGTIVSLRGLK